MSKCLGTVYVRFVYWIINYDKLNKGRTGNYFKTVTSFLHKT